MKTSASAFPLVFLLAGIALFWEWRRFEVSILACLFLSLLAGYTLQIETSDTVVGERYYFEAYFAWAIVAARGASLLRARWNFSTGAMRSAFLYCAFLQIPSYFLFGQLVYARVMPYTRVKHSIDQLHLRDAVVFMKPAEGFKAYDLNENEPNWQQEPVFYVVDPGPERRIPLVARLHRTRWAVVSFDPDASLPVVESVSP